MTMNKPNKVSIEKALSIKTELRELCKKYGLFWDSTDKGNPDVNMIIFNISIKVTDK